jgi:hypothetical protein
MAAPTNINKRVEIFIWDIPQKSWIDCKNGNAEKRQRLTHASCDAGVSLIYGSTACLRLPVVQSDLFVPS